MKKEIVDID